MHNLLACWGNDRLQKPASHAKFVMRRERISRILFRIWLCLWFFANFAFAADGPQPGPLTIREKYWQVLPYVRWVYLDHAGDPWFSRRGGNVAASYGKPLRTLPEDETMLLGDRKGRIWVRKEYQIEPVRFYDGNEWHQTDIKARLATEDEKGRVFLLDATTIHVLDEDKWTRQQLFAHDNYAEPHFLNDALGRVWFWAIPTRSVGEPIRAGTRGVWVFNGREWLNHSTSNDVPTDEVEALLPLDNDRFVIVQPDSKPSPRAWIWSPSRKLSEQETAIFPPGDTPTRVYFWGTDPDGKHFFVCEGGSSKYFLVSPDGTVAWLSEPQVAAIHRSPRGRYENRHRLYSRLDENPPPTPDHGVICRDRSGRTYFEGHGYNNVGMVWPAHERSGDTVRIAPSRVMRRVFQGTDGTIWGQPRGGVLARWDGAGWQDAPVKIPPHPEWRSRASPPWQRWYRQPVLLPGANGSFLVVAVRDIYQAVGAGLKKDAPRAGEKFWLEAWLLKDGEWLGPQRLKDLLSAERTFLIEHFSSNAKQSDFLSVQSDGKYLWVAYGGEVFVHMGDAVARWNPPERLALDLPASSLCRMPDGRMLWCTLGTETHTLQLFALTYDGTRIANEPLIIEETLPPYLQLGGADDWYPYATKSGDLWLWLRDRVLQFREGKWVLRKDLTRPLYEEPDGSLWFTPGSDGDPGYRIVKGRETLIHTGANNYGFGLVTPSPSGELHAACGYWIVTLSDAETPLKREIIKARIADQYLGVGHAFELEKGRFLLDNGFIGSEPKVEGR
jgi:hypothetical protein